MLRQATEQRGDKFLGGGHPFGELSALILVRLPDDLTATRIGLSASASGAMAGGKITRPVSGPEFAEALSQAAENQYTAPGR